MHNTAINDADDPADSGSDLGGISSDHGSSEGRTSQYQVHKANVADRYIIPAKRMATLL
jgi:hypothetical protein